MTGFAILRKEFAGFFILAAIHINKHLRFEDTIHTVSVQIDIAKVRKEDIIYRRKIFLTR